MAAALDDMMGIMGMMDIKVKEENAAQVTNDLVDNIKDKQRQDGMLGSKSDSMVALTERKIRQVSFYIIDVNLMGETQIPLGAKPR